MHTTRARDHTGFKTNRLSIRRNIFLPKYYNPEIAKRLEELATSHTLVSLGDLVRKGHISADTGDEIGKMAYGTGTIPFVRTSDVSNWELKTDAKQGVSEEVFGRHGHDQDVKAGDIMFVRDGTYLIGQTALVTQSDLPLLYQSHILKLRVGAASPISAPLLMACLNAPIVKRQIRAKQFTADIIDTVGDRWRELVLPIPRDPEVARRVSQEVAALTQERSRLRDKIRKLPYWVEGAICSTETELPEGAQTGSAESGNPGFAQRSSAIRNGVFIPKYYDPSIAMDATAFGKDHRLVSLEHLVRTGIISWDTGVEVGKMAYGTGEVPFIRTSDISNWELKGDPKQAVSEDVYAEYAQDVRAGDIFVVRDGTYLVGTSCILTTKDTKILYCGGLYKLRVERPEELDPYLLLALLNAPFVRRQMRSKQFTRDIIDTLGKRLFEVVLPVPKDRTVQQAIANATREVIETRARLRDRTKEIAIEVEGIKSLTEADAEALEVL